MYLEPIMFVQQPYCNTMKQIVFLVVLFLILSCNTSTKNNEVIELLTPTEFKMQSQSATLVDIRTPQEFQQGHIENAINIDFYNRNFLSNFKQFNKNEPLFIYCRSGNRTSQAASKLAEMGFRKVYDLKNGINNWKKENLKIVK